MEFSSHGKDTSISSQKNQKKKKFATKIPMELNPRLWRKEGFSITLMQILERRI